MVPPGVSWGDRHRPDMIACGTAARKRETMAIWDPQHETSDREQLEELQLPRVRDMLARVYERVPFYRDKLGAAGFEPGDLTSLDDVAALPFTEKTDFRDNYPYGLFAVPVRAGAELPPSSAPA